jgi:hypothetical protein
MKRRSREHLEVQLPPVPKLQTGSSSCWLCFCPSPTGLVVAANFTRAVQPWLPRCMHQGRRDTCWPVETNTDVHTLCVCKENCICSTCWLQTNEKVCRQNLRKNKEATSANGHRRSGLACVQVAAQQLTSPCHRDRRPRE